MPLIPSNMNPMTASSTEHDTSGKTDSATHTRGGQSPPPEEQGESQIGSTGSGNPREDAESSTGDSKYTALKDTAGKDEIRSTKGEDRGTDNLKSNPDGPLKKWSEDVGKRPQDWSAPGGSN